jgi:O-antigen ligase
MHGTRHHNPRKTNADSWFAQSVFYGLLGLIAWVPLPLASNRPWSWSLLSLLVGCLLIAWSVALLNHPGLMRLSWRRCVWVAVPFAAALIWMLIQTIGGTPAGLHDPVWSDAGRTLGRTVVGTIGADPSASIEGLLRLVSYGGVFWLAMQYARHPTYARQILWCVALVGIGYAIYGLTVFAAGNHTILWYDRWAYTGDLTSTFVSRSAFGAFAGIALLVSLALILQIAGRATVGSQGLGRSIAGMFDALPAQFYILVAGSLILATALILSHSRGAVAVTALGIGALLTAMMLRHKDRRRPIAFAAFIILIAGALVLQLSGKVTLGRVLHLADQGTGRDAIHSLTRRGIDDAPITGRGLDTFRHLYFRYRELDIPWGSPRYDKAHSTYLELLLESGLIGFSLLMVAVLTIIGTITVAIARRRRDAVYPIVGFGTTVLIGTHALLDFSVQMPAIAVTYAAILGVAFAQSWRSDRPEVATGNTDQGNINAAVIANS